MKTEDISNPQDSSNGVSVSERGLLLDSVHNLSDSLAANPVDEDDRTNTEKTDIEEVADTVNSENDPTETQEGIRDWSSDMEISIETDEVICVEDKLNGQNLQVHAPTVTIDVQEEQDTLTSRLRAADACHEVQTESHLHQCVMSATGRSGVKRARMAFDNQQPSVHVKYHSITRASKKRLQELLRQWSEWQAEDCSSNEDLDDVESGEETYFPALRVGTENYSAVSFCIDSQVSRERQKGFVPPESNSVPLYDRASCLTSDDGSNNLSGSLEMIDNATRCFNCGSYNHSLKECLKPRDNDAVNKARNQYMAKKKLRGGSCNSVRYYQKSQGGKYDDLKPGVLSDETRKLLGLTEFDPPPWLNRMRELGYPPGYLAPEDEDQQSGIVIFDEGETEENKDAEVEVTLSEQKLKKTAEFPGINASIPAAADGTRWALVTSSTGHSCRTRSAAHQPPSHNHKPDGTVQNDEGPAPGIRPGLSPVMMSYPPRQFPSSTSPVPVPIPIPIPIPNPNPGRSFRGYGEHPPPGVSPVMSFSPRYGTTMNYHSPSAPPSYLVPGARSPVSLSERSWGKPLAWVPAPGNDEAPPGVDAHDRQLKGYGYYGSR